MLHRTCLNEGNTPPPGDVNYHSRSLGRYKPKPPPRNPNTTKTYNNYHVSNELFPCEDLNSKNQIKLKFPKTIAQGHTLNHSDFINGYKLTSYGTDKEKIRDIGGEDADVSSQSSSSSNIRSGGRLQSNLGKVLRLINFWIFLLGVISISYAFAVNAFTILINDYSEEWQVLKTFMKMILKMTVAMMTKRTLAAPQCANKCL